MSITVQRGSVWATIAATSDHALAVDTAQYHNGDGPCMQALRERRLVLVDDFSTDTRWHELVDAALPAGLHSVLSVPITTAGAAVGSLNFYGGRAGAFTEDAVRTATACAEHTALAWGYQLRLTAEREARAEEHAIAETLQRSLLPRLPEVPGVRAAARYLAGGPTASVGGDWYDLFVLPDGAVGIAIGDVMGHDLAAAVAMGQLRSVLRSYAWEGIGPSLVLDRLDRLVQGFDMAQVATAIYGRLVFDQDEGGRSAAMLRYTNAGHLPPLVHAANGTVRLLSGGRSRLIGAPVVAETRAEAIEVLPPGATLLLYTDGLVERRSFGLDHGLHRLQEAAAAHHADDGPDALCDRLLETLLEHGSDDDTALLALQIR